jgi:uncharacterized Fe-S radical SAM superfamily protein PflX
MENIVQIKKILSDTGKDELINLIVKFEPAYSAKMLIELMKRIINTEKYHDLDQRGFASK